VSSKNNLVVLVLLCGLGLLGIYISKGVHFDANPGDTMIFLAAYALPILLMGLALFRPPVQAWHGAISLAGLGVVAVRGRVWKTIPDFTSLDGRGKAALVMLAVGLVASAVLMLRPPQR